MSGPRAVAPERLDVLPADDPAARRSRRDLARINLLMGTAGAVARGLLRHLPERRDLRLLEVGAGDAATGLAVVRRLAGATRPGAAFGGLIVLLDRLDLVGTARRAEFAALGWRAEPAVCDVRDWLATFLHHFDNAALTELLAALARVAPLVVAAEPRRGAVSLGAARLVGAIGANAVTRHDAPVSVRAGFAGGELSALWPRAADPRADGWRLEEARAGPFTHVFAAAREGVAARAGAR
jgi:hypothetical protein